MSSGLPRLSSESFEVIAVFEVIAGMHGGALPFMIYFYRTLDIV